MTKTLGKAQLVRATKLAFVGASAALIALALVSYYSQAPGLGRLSFAEIERTWLLSELIAFYLAAFIIGGVLIVSRLVARRTCKHARSNDGLGWLYEAR